MLILEDASPTEGEAEVEYLYTNNSDTRNVRSFLITSKVWGFSSKNYDSRIAGFLSIEQTKGKDLKETKNYAITYCELEKLSEKCEMSTAVSLNGIGMHAECSVVTNKSN